jgi:glycosyltransferase involved in cell wall biosynthesis
MKNQCKIAVIIPCYRVKGHILQVLQSIPDWVDAIIAVDDACPEQSGAYAAAHFPDPRFRLVTHPRNRGVGGAMGSGYRAALETDAEIFVKLDGDGQMDPARIAALLKPVCSGKADFAKANRFYDFRALYHMPLVRRIGNMGLTLLVKLASGYWDVSDPTNGFFAIHRTTVELLDLDAMDTGYFFECRQLVDLNIVRAVIAEVPIPARYGDEASNLSVRRSLADFPFKLLCALGHRILWRYYVYSMSAVTIFLTVGGLLTAGSLAFGSYRWYLGAFAGQTQSAGTVALGLFPAIIGVQMLLQAMILDILDKPSTPIQTQTKWEYAEHPPT